MKRKSEKGVENLAYVDTEGVSGRGIKLRSFKNKIQPQFIEDQLEDDDSTTCGYFGLPCPGQSCCLTAVGILLFLCWASTIQGMVVNGFVNAVISSLERRFDLSSTMTGVIAGSYDIGSMLSVIPITYFGGLSGASKPKYIATGLFVMGMGSFMFCLPHFLAGTYISPDVVVGNATSTDLCLASDSVIVDFAAEESLAASKAKLSVYKYFFIFGQILHGIGAAPLITLGTTFLDESVGKVSAPMYIGIFQTFFVVGPALGYLIGGSLLQVYVDLSTEGLDPNLNPTHPLWVGAWWIGFLISGAMSVLCAAFIGSYPAVLPGAKTQQKNSGQPSVSTKNSTIEGLKKMPLAIKALLANPTYMFISIGGAADGLVVAGLSAFLPKFIQSQYKFSAALSAGLVGVLVIPAGGLGTFSGGFIAKRFKLNRSQVIKMYILAQMVTIPLGLGFLLYCPQVDFSGVTKYQTEEKSMYFVEDLTIGCNQNCSCSAKEFKPVCGEDNVMYFSACFAGCTDKILNGVNGTDYSECSCVDGGNKLAFSRPCTVDCQSFYPFAVILFISIWFTFMSAMPNVVATLRSVEIPHRSLALGIQSIILRLIGSIPGPVLFGAIIDQTCLLLSESCLFYDNYSMSLFMMLMVVIVKLIGVGFFCVALFFSLRLKIPDEDEHQIRVDPPPVDSIAK